MTNAVPRGSPGAPATSYDSGPSANMPPRRSSYASVAAGTANAAASPHDQTPSARSAIFSHLTNTNSHSRTQNPTQGDEQHRQGVHQPTASTGRENGGGNLPSGWGKGDTIPSHLPQYSLGGGYNMKNSTGTSNNGFFRPSYLRDSKYLEKLEVAHIAKLAAQKEAALNHNPSNPGCLSTSSSSVSLHRMAPSHRGMTYEIVEHQPPLEEDGLTPLPSKWAEVERQGELEIAGDGLDIRLIAVLKTADHEAAAVRADHPMPPQCGLYYYEVTIISTGKEGMIGVGFSSSKVSLGRLPGWETESWAYHGDDGKSFSGHLNGKTYGPKFSSGDVIGCGVNFLTGTAFFTKNGVFQGNAFKDLKDVEFYPSVGMKRQGAHLRVNFGQMPFMYDIDGMMADEKSKIKDEISSVNISTIFPSMTESSLVKELVAQFLQHEGYVESVKAFAEEVKLEANALKIGSGSSGGAFEVQEDVDAMNRQQIRTAILEGDVDKALKRTHAYYPYVLQNNPRINFRLKCRKFVEMMRNTTEVLDTSPSKQPKIVNGHADDVFDQAMEVDEPMSNGDDWDRMDTEEIDVETRYQNKLDATLSFAQELKFEFRDNPNKEFQQTLQQIFALFAYEDPRRSPTAPLMDETGRAPVAEELNSAILVSLGKSSSAAIERLCQQTEVLVGEISEDGGAGAFINIDHDFLQ